MPHYVILGAGISGLSLGWYLKQSQCEDIQITILEAGNRAGGWIRTKAENEFLFEQGPRSFRPEGPGIATLQLIEDLGLQDDIIFASKAAKRRYLYINQRLHCLPTGLLSLLSSPFCSKILKAMWKDWFAKKGVQDDESIHSFVSRRFGLEIAELFFDPLISGIYAGDINQLSMNSCFPSLQQLEQKHGSILRGALKKRKNTLFTPPLTPFVEQARHQGLFTLKHGVQSLIDALAKPLSDCIKLERAAKQLTFTQDAIHLELADGQHIYPDKLFIAIPPKKLADLITFDYPTIGTLLNSIPTASVGAINFGYHNPVLRQEGFGYLIPSREKQKLLGVVWDSSAFPQQNAHPQQTRLTAMLGGMRCRDFESHSETDLIEMALKELQTHLGIKQTPDFISVNRALNAIPQYIVGHQSIIKQIDEAFKKLSPNVHVLGNGFHGISVNDCIAKAKSQNEETFA